MRVLVWMMITLTTLKAGLPVVIWGKKCPTEVKGRPNFDVKSYLGQWFQLTALPFLFVNSESTCVWAKYALEQNGKIAVNNTYIKDGKRSGVTGEAAAIANTSGELNVEFFSNASSTGKANYIVLNTDYAEFSYVWSCTDLIFAHSPILWILNRKYNRTSTYINQQANNALEILRGFGYDTESVNEVYRRLIPTNQTNCDYNNYQKISYQH
jgi:lipocalin